MGCQSEHGGDGRSKEGAAHSFDGLRTGQRRIMRTYGANFRHLEGEPVDPDDESAEGE